jgi:hypothetical protein
VEKSPSARDARHGGTRVATIIFTSTQRRLSVRGPCLDGDVQHVVTALETFGRACPRFVLDMTQTDPGALGREEV